MASFDVCLNSLTPASGSLFATWSINPYALSSVAGGYFLLYNKSTNLFSEIQLSKADLVDSDFSYNITGLTNGQNYAVTLYVLGPELNNPRPPAISNTRSATPADVPDAPILVSLVWDASGTNVIATVEYGNDNYSALTNIMFNIYDETAQVPSQQSFAIDPSGGVVYYLSGLTLNNEISVCSQVVNSVGFSVVSNTKTLSNPFAVPAPIISASSGSDASIPVTYNYMDLSGTLAWLIHFEYKLTTSSAWLGFGSQRADSSATFVITGLTNNLAYQIRAYDTDVSGNRSEFSNVETATPFQSPVILTNPLNGTFNTTQTDLHLSWLMSTSAVAPYCSLAVRGSFISNVYPEPYVNTGTGSYAFDLSGSDLSGNTETDASGTFVSVTATPYAFSSTDLLPGDPVTTKFYFTAKPNTPGAIAVTTTYNSAIVSWIASAQPPSVDYYLLKYCLNNSPSDPSAVSVQVYGTSAPLTPLLSDTLYYVFVYAHNAASGLSESYSTANFRTDVAPAAPGAPTNVDAIAGDNTLQVTWQQPATSNPVVSNYAVYVFTSQGCVPESLVGGAPLYTGNADENLTYPGLPNALPYWIKVRAYNTYMGGSWGPYSEVAGPFSPSDGVVPAPTDLSYSLAIVDNETDVTLSWRIPSIYLDASYAGSNVYKVSSTGVFDLIGFVDYVYDASGRGQAAYTFTTPGVNNQMYAIQAQDFDLHKSEYAFIMTEGVGNAPIISDVSLVNHYSDASNTIFLNATLTFTITNNYDMIVLQSIVLPDPSWIGAVDPLEIIPTRPESLANYVVTISYAVSQAYIITAVNTFGYDVEYNTPV